MDDAARRELEGLQRYAQLVSSTARDGRPDVVPGALGYIGGALTTLHHLGLISGREHMEWWKRLTAEIPSPGGWVGGEMTCDPHAPEAQRSSNSGSRPPAERLAETTDDAAAGPDSDRVHL